MSLNRLNSRSMCVCVLLIDAFLICKYTIDSFEWLFMNSFSVSSVISPEQEDTIISPKLK